MSDIKRWTPFDSKCMQPDEDGKFVLASDHDAEVKRLRRERDEALVDKERMDWIERNGIGCDKIGLSGYDVWRDGVRYHGETARAAIDAAKEEHERYAIFWNGPEW